jgi:AcrR family transcriptional regulator
VSADGDTKFAARRKATRATLVRLGLERFPLKGYSGTTIEDIIRASGYTRGAFYFHFPGKEEFLLAVLEYRAELRDEWWLTARDPALDGTRSAVAATLAHLDTLDDGGAWLMLIADFFQATEGEEQYVARLRALYDTWIRELTQFVEEMQARGFARTDAPAEQIAAQVFATAEGHTIHHVLYGLPATGVVDALVRVLRP